MKDRTHAPPIRRLAGLVCLLLWLPFMGSAQTVSLVQDLNPGSASSDLFGFVEFSGKLYYFANVTAGYELYEYDGSTNTMVQDLNTSGNGVNTFVRPVVYGGKLYFAGNNGSTGFELYSYDGTNIQLEADIRTGSASSDIKSLTRFDNKLFFIANNGTSGNELFSWDGTNLTLEADINSGSGNGLDKDMMAFGSRLFFNANDGLLGKELWSFDGTNAQLIADIDNGSNSSDPDNFAIYGGNLYFAAATNAAGVELYVFDGTNTTLVADYIPGSAGTEPGDMVVLGSNLYFSGNTPSSGRELLRYDGTNITLAADINPGSGSGSPGFPVVFGTKIFFQANNGTAGSELMSYDGNLLTLEADINSGASGSDVAFLAPYSGNLYFRANDGSGIGTEFYSFSNTQSICTTFDFSWQPNTTCPGDTVTFNIINPLNGATVSWDFGGLATSTDTVGKFAFASAGLYAIELTVTKPGCPVSVVTRDVRIAPVTLNAGLTHPSTVGGTNGGIDLLVGGGNAPFTYNWSTGASTEDITGIPAGTYAVTVTDANGCDAQASYTLDDPLTLEACLEDTLTFIPNDTSGGRSFQWNFGDGNSSSLMIPTHYYGALGSFTVSLTVVDTAGCATTTFYTVNIRQVEIITVTATNALCNGDSSGTATVTASGGTTPYTYLWSNGQTTQTATGLQAGTYTVTVTDQNGCQDDTTITISHPTPVVASAVVDRNVTCNGDADGQATASATGGTPGYTFAWSNGQTSATASGLSGGTYTVTVTDQNGCTDTASVTITEPPVLVATDTVLQNVSCFGFSDGVGSVNVTGGTPTYTYQWDNAAGNQTTQNATGLAAGTYTVTVTDNNGCTATATITITQPTNPLSLATTSQTNVSCNGFTDGTVTVAASGGTSPYAYNWSNGQTGATASNLGAGDYYVTVTDDSSCTLVDTITITEPPALIVSASVDNNVSCNGFADGQATASASGGTPGYTFAWSNGQTAATATGLAAGTYSVTITDQNGCIDSASVTITEPPVLVVSTTVNQNVSCYGFSDGVATVTATGGTPNYTYLWDANASGQTTATAVGLAAGTYSVTVTDANGCIDSATVTITQPDSLDATIAGVQNVSCYGFNDGQATVNVTGGTTPYSYNWSNGQTGATATNLGPGTYTVTVTDDSSCTTTATVTITQPDSLIATIVNVQNVSCYGFGDGEATVSVTGGTNPYTFNWSNGQTTATATNLSPGTYTVTVTDDSSCTATASITITQPDTLIVLPTDVQNVSCYGFNDGEINVRALGGSGSYTYNWSNGATTSVITNLGPGTYTVTVTDDSLCTATATVTITEPDSLVATIANVQNVSCYGFNDGQATVNVTGGTNPYSYAWSNGQTGATAINLGPGTYTVTVTDDSSCTATAQVTITEPDSLVATGVVVQNGSCYNFNDGEATVTVTGGTAPYNFNWSNGANTQTITNLAPGTYTVTVTDDSSCTATATVTITQPDSLVATITVDQNVSCNGDSDGQATVSVTGGTSPYTFNWSNGQTTATATNLAAGTYTVTVTDDSSCTATATVTITEPPVLVATDTVLQNVSCFGFSDGVGSVNVTGGTPGYTYQWDNAAGNQTTRNATGLAAGSYTVTVTDNNGCTAVATVTITQPANPISSTITSTNVSCNGFSDGTATVNANGGTPPYAYNWSNGQTTQTATGLSAGQYIVTVTDDSSCTHLDTIVITEPPVLVLSTNVDQNVSCYNFNDGVATVTATGGTPNYTYAWSNGQTTATATGLAAGSHSVTVTDANGCTDSATVIITQPDSLNATIINVQNVSCYGFNDGQATVSVTGGTTPYAYNWSNGQTGATAINLGPGTYTVTVTDDSSCTATATVTITEPDSITATGQVLQNVSCYNFNDGEATVNVTGGTAPYSFNWSNGQTTQTATGLAAGTYTVTITDDSSCTATATVTITQPDSLIATIAGVQNGSCYNFNDGEATVTVTGGTAPYAFNWSNGATTATITNLAPGTYTVTVTDDSSCTATATVTITQPDSITATTQVLQNVSCYGFADGEATVNVTGGTSPYAFNWSNGQTTQTATGLAAGTYTVTITDDSSCTATATVTITQPDSLIANGQVLQNVSCYGFADGEATVNVTGGTAPYAYLWSNGQTTQTATGLAPGTYTVTVTDDSSCTDVATVTITQPDSLIATMTVDQNVSCNGDSDGQATVSVTGGTQPYVYLWSNGQNTATATNLAAGTYTVTITDDSLCTVTATVTITEPAVLVATDTVLQNVSCFGFNDGVGSVNVTGGTPAYTYQWDNAAGNQTTRNATGLAAGSYTVTVTDNNGCTAVATVTITQPANPISSTITSTNVSCNGFSDGTATVNANGGTPPYAYNWSNGQTTQTATGLSAGQYIVTVTDDSSCTHLDTIVITEPPVLVLSTNVDQNVSCYNFNDGVATVTATGGTPNYTYAWSNGQTTATATGLAAGSHSVTVTDANGCTDSATVIITQPDSLIATIINVQNVSCYGFNDGQATVSVTGGTTPYAYNWSNGQTGATAINLGPGTYTVTVTDDSSCTATATVTITEPDSITATGQVLQNVSCYNFNDGEATVNVTGGTAPYSFNWSNGQTTQTATGLAAGTYTVTITDDSSCTATATVTITQPDSLIATIVGVQNGSCYNFNDGEATVTVTGGTAPYAFNWSNGATTATITNLAPGTYTVTVTDDSSCTATATVTITQPDSITATTQVLQNVSCYGFADGEATVNVTGGTSPYAFNWSNGQTTQTATGLAAGTYTVTITDDSSCTATATVTITQPDSLILTTQVLQNTSCNGFNDGEATVNVTGGTAPYAYLWSNGATTQTITGLAAGTYTVTVTDDSSCTATASVTITQPDSLNATVTVDQNVSCNGDSDGQATVSVTGGTAPYAYLWSNGQTTATATNLAAGTYAVTITDDSSCTYVASVTITEPPVLVATDTVLQNVSCFGFSDGVGSVNVTGGTPGYTYQWDNAAGNQTTRNATGLAAGSYTVTVTDNNGCTAVATVTITQPANPISSTITSTNVSCNGFSDGTATVNANGGTPPYAYNWSNGQTTQTATGLSAGQYIVTVTDDSACTHLDTIVITEPPVLVAAAVVDNNVSCYNFGDGQATASATGGTPNYTFAWSNGQTTATATNLVPGTYTVTVTDANGCIDSATITITQPDSLIATAVVDQNISCFGFNDGEATVTATGGSTPYTYNWSNGQTTATATNLTPGAHVVTVTDANGCTDVASVTISEPTAIVTTTNADSVVSCNGYTDGQASVVATGGTPPYNYLWSDGQTTPVATNLASGLYYVTVTDDSGCTKIDSIFISQPSPLTLQMNVNTNVSCNGFSDGEADVNVFGGTPSYTYLWSNGTTNFDLVGVPAGTYFVTVTDQNGCTAVDSVTITEPPLLVVTANVTKNVSCNGFNDGEASASATGGTPGYTYTWSNGASGASVTGLAAGQYVVTATDQNGCTATDTIVVTEPQVLVLTTTQQDVSCNGFADGSATVTATGGTQPYAYLWNTGATTATISGLSGGTYTVTVTDSLGCTETATVTINEPVQLATTTTSTDVSCNGGLDGTATVTATGGTTPYAYSWSNGQTTQTATGLAAGSYTVTVTDANGCTIVDSVTISEPPALVVTLVGQESCSNDNSGSVTATVSGGTPGYTYLWNTGATTQSITNVAPGTYTVRVTDSNGCTRTVSITLNGLLSPNSGFSIQR